MPVETAPIPDHIRLRKIEMPAGTRFREVLVTGPPGTGKSTLVSGLGGWPEEGVIDIATPGWWRLFPLSLRPRELHLAIPFEGDPVSRTVYEDAWLASPRPPALERIRVPPPRRWWLGVNWRNRFVFDVQLPPPAEVFARCRERAQARSHDADQTLTLEQATWQHEVYAAVAWHLQNEGMRVHVRTEHGGRARALVGFKEAWPS